jgi:tetraacyldisaccharide 4'-kinase
MDQSTYRELVGGSGGGLGKKALRGMLRLVSCGYRIAIAARNLGYDTGVLRSHRLRVPVISVGNVTTGGTGKTPLVIWLCRMLESKHRKAAILTRGYKARSGTAGDEPAMLARACPQTRVIVDADRVRGGARAIDEYEADVLVMDDGFQHRRLKRDLDIVAIDATRPFGYDRVLPAGLLREPKEAIRRAHAVVITRYDNVTIGEIDRLVAEIQNINPNAAIAKARHSHPCARTISRVDIAMEDVRAKKVFAFCGIGNPEAFLNRLRDDGIDIAGSMIYNDHHEFIASDIDDICNAARKAQAELILSTEKDWVKTALFILEKKDITFAYMVLELEFSEGTAKIERLVDRILEQNPPS